MDQVVQDVHPVERLGEAVGVGQAVLNDVDVVMPRNVCDFLGRADQDFDLVAGFEEPGDQPTADVAGGAGHQHCPGVLRGVGMRSFRRLQRNSCGWGWR
ncbi:hypothetical protein PJL18_04240 [Paenarthrobacter nicotinovorans]|nr:hypothetical protein [Paenarthrobacter nicotinovorans]